MGTLACQGRELEYMWASDVAFDGIRLEVRDEAGATLFDLSLPEQGAITVNTFSNEVPLELIASAVEVLRKRESSR